MRSRKDFIYLFLTILIFMGVDFGIIFCLKNLYLGVGLTLTLSLGLAAIVFKRINRNSLEGMKYYLSNLDNMDSINLDDKNMPEEIKDELSKFTKNIKKNLKTQVEISTEIYNVCRQLSTVSQESLDSTESITSFVEVADANTMEQSSMLESTNSLAHEVFTSLNDMEGDIMNKIGFISDSIETAQKGMENIQMIDKRTNLSKDMLGNSLKQILKLRDYSDEIVGLIDLISSISKETNMLSLNASIEAARAGEHGKGFAVVAMEVGKLANETERVSSRIEEVIYTLKDDISSVSASMEEDMKYIEESCSVMGEINEEFKSTIKSLNIGRESLEEITGITKENNVKVGQINTNIDKVTSFSQEIAAHMEETTAQVVEQYSRAKDLQEIVEKIKDAVYDMQQFVVGKFMEEKMLKGVRHIRESLKDKEKIDDMTLDELIKETGMDDIYVANSSGVVEYSNEKSAIGLNIYKTNRSFLMLKEGKKEFVDTPIMLREEDGKPFKFLAVIDENERLYEVGLSLESMIKGI